MPITIASAPQDATEVAVRGLTSLKRAEGVVDPSEAGGGDKQPVKASLPIYHVGPEALASAAPTAAARRIGWRYLVGDGSAAHTVEVIGTNVASITQGSVPTNLARALGVASNVVDSSQPYEARVLVFGRAGNSLLWLHASAGSDRFFSLGPEPKEVDGGSAILEAGQKARMRQDMNASRGVPPRTTGEVDESGG
jgi:hypothetical protein